MIDRMLSRKSGVKHTRAKAMTTRPLGNITKRHSSTTTTSSSHGSSSSSSSSSSNNSSNNSSSTSAANRRLDNLTQKFLTEPARTIPILDECDVLVVGSGPAGLSAAIASARAGVDTLLVERYGCFGGVITTVGMETLGWYRYEGTTDVEGIGIEMEKMAARMNPNATKFAYNESECLDAEMFKLVADDLVRECGIRPLLHTYVVDVLMEQKNVIGVIVESKSGRAAIRAKRVIDASGDADVAWLSGAECRQNQKIDAMGMTQVFVRCS